MRRSALGFFSTSWSWLAFFTAAVVSPAFAAAAEAGPSLDLRGFRPSTDPRSGIYLEPAEAPGTLDWSMGLWLSYANRPITLRDATTNEVAFNVIGHQLTGDLTASVGFARRFALGLDVPFVLAQDSDDPTAAATRVLGDAPIPRQAMGDLALTGKITLVRPSASELGGFALALHERFTFPTGDEASYIGEGSVTSETRILAEYRLVALGVHLAAGVKLRGDMERFACASTPPPTSAEDVDACATRFQHEIPFGLGFSLRPQALGLDNKGRWTWFLETHGHVPMSPLAPFSSGSARVASLGLDAGARLALGDVSILAGLGTSLLGSIGSAPFRAVLSVGWAPRLHDADGDGVEDDKDECRELAEDRDGFQDGDGCPEMDNDDDGVPDPDDQCAAQAEDEDGFDDDDGCPEPDNDGDSVLDVVDTCPTERGLANPVPAKNGCPVRDVDGDGIEGEKDKCPEVAEDDDSFEDDDGCPDPDNDDDSILDKADACPDVAGIESSDPKERGCPDPDRDSDTFEDVDDKCPGEAEVWNGLDDGDGCPDGDPKAAKKPLVVVKEGKAGSVLEIAGPVKLTAKGEVEPASEPTLRAVASALLKKRGWRVAVGVRAVTKGGEEDAKKRAAELVEAIRRFTRIDATAEVVSWGEVKDVPGAAALGIGFKLVGPRPAAVAGPEAKP